MELGADLVNTAIAIATDPERMAAAFRKAVEAGRVAYEIGLPDSSAGAVPTSPLTAYLTHFV
jgi:thiazole synthase